MIRAHHVSVTQRAYLREDGTERLVNRVTAMFGSLHLCCDADAYSIRLAKELADDHQATFYYDEHTQDLVRKALGVNA